MYISHLLDSLNNKQKEAVSAPLGNILVLAGAGSGKTRVLTHRIAWLLAVENNPPSSILAVTFTNKAATEMYYRIKNILGKHPCGMWIGTFHSLAYRILRIHYIEANLPKDFHIIDSEDQHKLLKRLIRYLNLDENYWSARQAMCYINAKKDEGYRPQKIDKYLHVIEATWQRIYAVYQEACERSGLVDFAELILRTYEMLRNKATIANYYRERFYHILVDEFQDTNHIQYSWIRLLANCKGYITIVGDDDQSIYGWRGAKVNNMQSFIQDFPQVKTISLDQNYRSTKNILKAANYLIANNKNRLIKNLWTNSDKGEYISLYCAMNEIDEAYFVVNKIILNHKNGLALKDCVILYRNNAQSRVLEEVLLHLRIPYHIYGGIQFFERKEVKDALAYLRIINNRNDDAAYDRIINTPPRGIGTKTIEIVRKMAQNRQLTLWQASIVLLQEKVLKYSSNLALQEFIKLIENIAQNIANLPLEIQTNLVIKQSGLWNMYQQEQGEKGQSRIKNLEELVNATEKYNNHYNKDMVPLQAFLSNIALNTSDEFTNHNKDTVQLMTLHAAKGLEFQQVFIVGLEEGIFPSQIAIKEQEQMEEERRLAYVGITRAIKKLTITYAQTRRIYGQKVFYCKSRFINELPQECILMAERY
ncbi:DNA helicase II [Candidatus Palibaumannia cicadellinicola]|uniref:DNA 3'-5' helicase n=1 Tax=Baumannia cicadellinicola subsp. Homalodisca coagulata TaxID=374463 RepID=Q1LTW8_BAUCH|nr:DNA helicase II [Baumannia cicadellinicola str. Hc (Homalodisca coagulata)]MBS0032653.1 DNA helicase II [Candidatus Baumannia cicadellinicola]